MMDQILGEIAFDTLGNLIKMAVSKNGEKMIKNLYSQMEKNIAQKQLTRKEQISELVKAYKERKLVLTLGAGVSIEHGLPDWNTLLQKLLIDAVMKETKETMDRSLVVAKLFIEVGVATPLAAARFLKGHYELSGGMSFEENVRDVVYSEINAEKRTKFFNEVRQLCIAAGNNPNLDSIITYNYDDLLEMYLSELESVDIPYKSIYATGMKPNNGELPIYHVHGYLPREGIIDKTNEITLSEDIYHQQYNHIYSWNNIVQINKFRDNVCLFIGLSFSDPNLRRLLDIAMLHRGNSSEFHFVIKKRTDIEAFKSRLSKSLELNPGLLNEKERVNLNFDDTVKYLLKITEKFEENDALSFGVRTIWIDDYSEIPNILSSVRKINE